MSGFFGGGSGQVTELAPRIASLQIQTSVQGRPIPILYGRTRLAPNLIDYDDFVAHKHKESSGGKGGGGGVTTVSYTYSCAVMFGLCEGPIASIGTVWRDKEISGLAQLGLSFFNGSSTQAPFGYWSSAHPGKALSYRGHAYLAASNFDLGSAASLPNLSFEVWGNYQYTVNGDAIPAIVAGSVLCEPQFGAGFPILLIGDWTQWQTYCIAAGIFISPAYSEQKPAAEILRSLATISNTALFYSEGKLKAVPYGDTPITANGATYVPNTTPVYDLTPDDFLAADDEPPIKITRGSGADAYNQVQIQYYDRFNQYNDAVAPRQDLADINLKGLRPMPPVEMREICDTGVAYIVAQLMLQRALYVRNTYEYRLGVKYSLLEPMDIVTLTNPNQHLDQLPVQITRIEEDDNGDLLVTAQDYLGGVSESPLYPNQEAGGYAADYNADPGDANPPIIFEPPENLAISAMEFWIMASGGPMWGGCQVWASSDDVSYVNIGTIKLEARQGVLAAALAAGSDPDTTHTLSVDMSLSGAQVLSGSQADVDAFNTLCFVDGELIAYRDSNLVATNRYDLTYLRRGVYNSPVTSHAIDAPFVRVDIDAAARYEFDATRIGQAVYIKLVSFNIWGGGLQDISTVPTYVHAITGEALNSPPDNVANLHTNHRANLLYAYWDAVVDFRTVEYEWRTGPTWNTATVLGRTSEPNFAIPGNGTFWVAARALGSNGVGIYSVTPTQLIVSGAALQKNVVATFDEPATGWTGTLSGGAVITGGAVLQLDYAGDVADIIDLGDATEVPDLGSYGSVVPAGIYQFPSAHDVTLADVANCTVQFSYDVTAYVTGTGTVPDPGPDVDVIPQVQLSADGVTWGAWQDYKPGVYTFKALRARISLASRDPNITPQVTGLQITVDVPDKTDSGQVSTSSGGTVHFTFASPFNGGADPTGGGAGLPVLQVTINGASAGDDVRITNKSRTGFDVDVVNAGSRVVRSLNVFAQGY